MSEKIHKILATVGLGSRREAESWIVEGRVSVNGNIAKVGDRALPSDKIMLDGRVLSTNYQGYTRVLMYNKPEGEICSTVDGKGRATVYERLPRLSKGRWISVGRLDINTSGLLLFTDNGELANRLMHPRYEISRQYLVRVYGAVNQPMITRLMKGVVLDDGIGRFDTVKPNLNSRSDNEINSSNKWYRVTISEGRKREVRRLWQSQGVEVNRLKRIGFGPIELSSIVRKGEFMYLNEYQTKSLFGIVQLDAIYHPEKEIYRDMRQRKEKKLRARGSNNSQKKTKNT
ncbi:MAG: 23S rRNA pseudouridylate synthase B [Cellvibrionales bacterium TMED49]|nr:23S rRNA pseudouridylate synthase B [Porticoccaceae bacterium]OUU39603.1 MAG: 23S rRNA pseudouridylate synthase B [Cellvibrionales bacterium TMED49]